MPATLAEVLLWDRVIGALAWDPARRVGAFEYTADFLPSGIAVSPLTMPLRGGAFSFPDLPERTFKGLPGLIADSLPDRFGNLLIDQWLAREGRTPADFNPVERLCYLGARGMGALEFRPALRGGRDVAAPVQIDALVRLANDALARKAGLATTPAHDDAEHAAALRDILRVGTSAGGARAKAVVAWNPATGEFRSGQVEAPPGFEHWLLKFDGVSENRDKESLADPQGYGKIEYAYQLMARAAGITMSDCRLFEENGRAHFMTRRFDRPQRRDQPGKLHLQSLCALAHYDFNAPGAHAYEQAFAVARALALPPAALEELFRRAVFNVIARNQDDHTKNIAFLMDQSGRWTLAPAYDVAYAYNPDGQWTARHQMTLAGKLDDFTPDDLLACARAAGLKTRRAKTVIAEVAAAVRRWPEFATSAAVPEDWTRRVAAAHRLALAPAQHPRQ
jgi:serine/threonine-protein kinase HipA